MQIEKMLLRKDDVCRSFNLPELPCCDDYVSKNMWQNKNGLHVLM